ncbi:cytochrome P450 94B3-like [Carica papaya]|uniref:cytochrome P450 94B3-like n=1 Tax=Carica papaya TaxID=3649 RepID=UPI000B8CBCDC|nr:cytochrome P450 94B3-like [Carica papaya]
MILLAFLVFSLVFSFLYFFFIFITKVYSFLSLPPSTNGPPSYPFIGCLLSFSQNCHRLLDWYTELLSQSPTNTIVVNRLGARRTIVTANPENVEYILKTNFCNFPKGKPFTELLGDLLGRGIFNVDGELWSTQRKLASHEFSTRSLREFVVKTLQEEVEERLIPVLDEAMERQTVVDLQEILRRFAFDVVCKVSLGTDPCCLDLSRPLPALVIAFDSASEISAMRAMEPMYAVWKIKRTLGLGTEKKLKEAIKVVHGSVLEIVQNKKKILGSDQENQNDAVANHSEDLLSRLLSAGHDEEIVRDMVISFIMAGRDTTSAGMTWLFWLLSKNHKAEEMIVHEVNSVIQKKGGDDKTKTTSLDFEALKELHFTKACLCESMRLYPPVAWDSKHAADDDVLPDGTRLDKGDRVTYFPYGMGRMETIWGKNRLEFRPDRWLEEGDQGVNPYKFPVFQAGPRVCLGKEMAFIQMKYVVTSVLRQFEIKPFRKDRPVFVPLLTAHMSGGFKVLIKKRNQ